MAKILADVEVYLHHETQKAWLVSLDRDKDRAVWVPKSLGEMEVAPGKRQGWWILTLPENIAVDKGLV